MGRKLLTLLFVLICSAIAFGQSHHGDLLELRYNLEYLSSDELMGRETSTEGERLASEFIAKKLEEYGVKPFGDNGTYFQYFSLIATNFTPESKVKIYSPDGSEKVFQVKTDFIIDARRIPDKKFTGRRSDVVFAGFGITAPEYDYDNYEGLDVKGKTVFVLDDEPLSTDTNFFRGERATRYSFWGTKWRIAREKGAAGLVIIATPDAIKEWKRLSEWSLSIGLGYPSNDIESGSDRIPVVCVLPEAAEEILDDEEMEYAQVDKLFKKGNKIPSFALKKRISFDLVFKEEKMSSRNVVGIIEGTDEVLKNEYVSLGAHYDHEGVSNGQVYNGADDNASGTVVVMEVGKLLAKANQNKRSVLVMLYSGEEKGLFGSRYLTENADYVKDIVVNINMDMVGRMSEDSLHCIGSRRINPKLGQIIEEVNARTSKFYLDYVFDDPNDPNRFYERSDHYNFAKKGIPIAFFFDNMNDDYHKPTDDAHKVNYKKLLKVADLVYELSLEIANLDHKLTTEGQN